MKLILPVMLVVSLASVCHAQQLLSPPRCEVIPLDDERASFQIDGVEKLRWNFGVDEPVPYFYPLFGPSGAMLTRMGHPGAPDHDHHRSVWFGHHDVAGVGFWNMAAQGTVRQKQWLSYEDGDGEGVMAVELGWYSSGDEELLSQQLIAAVRPLEDGEYVLETQSTFLPGAGREETMLGKTNFGIFAVRVAKGISAHFGGGQLRSSEGALGERAVFGQSAKWVDYSGPVAEGGGVERRFVVQGITYLDHPENPRHPPRWHVRDDGWMTASLCFDEAYPVRVGRPLTLRYLLYVHRGGCDPAKAEAVYREFAARKPFAVTRSTRPHRHFEAQRP